MSYYEIKRFGDVVVINPPVKLSKGVLYDFVSMEALNTGFKYVYPNQKREVGGGAKFREKDTLFARITPCLEHGKICQVKDLKGGIGFGSTEFFVFSGKEGLTDNDFVYYLCLTEIVRKTAIASMVGASGRQRAQLDVIENLELPIPDLPIQKKIASILCAFDDLIQNNLKRIKLLKEAAELIYREWFVNLRFPGYENVKILNGVPEGWKSLPLMEVIEQHIGGGWGNEVKDDKHNVGSWVIRGTDIPKLASGDFANVPFRWQDFKQIISRKLDAGDIIFEVSGGSKDTGVGRSMIITKAIVEVLPGIKICASFCKKIKPKKDFAYLLSCTFSEWKKSSRIEVYEKQSASNIVNFNWSDFIRYEDVLIPNKEILNLFNENIGNISNLIGNLTLQINKFKQTRDLLLPKLMSGSIDLENLEIETIKNQEYA